MKLMTLVPLTCALLVGWAPGASAASLSINAPDEVLPSEQTVNVAYSGVAEGSQSIFGVSAFKGATSCAPTYEEQAQQGSASAQTGQIALPAGSFSGTAKLSAGQGLAPGDYRVCAYLKQNNSDVPPVVAADTFVVNPEKIAVRTYTSNFFGPATNPFTTKPLGVMGISLTSFPIAHGTNGSHRDREKFAATVQVLVSPAVKAKHNLPSTVLMRGDAEKGRWNATATKAVSRKLKKIKKLRATYKMRYTAPFTETVTRQVFLVNNAFGSDEDGGLVFLSSSGDTNPAAIHGGSGSIGGGSDDGNGDCTSRC